MDNYSLPRRIWRIIYPVLIFVGIQLVISILVSICATVAFTARGILSGASGFDPAALTDAVTRFVKENAITVVFAANIVSYSVFFPIWLRTRDRAVPYNNKNPVFLGILVIGFFAGFNVVLMWIFGLTDIIKYFPSYDDVAEVFTSGSLIMQIIAAGIAAPVVEELLFRGILINRMKWLPAWSSVFIQALLFGVVHFNWFQSIYAFLAGILLGLIYVKYRSIILTIIGHIAFNLVSVILSEFLTERTAVVIVLLCPIITAACGITLIVRSKSTQKNTISENNAQVLPLDSERAGPYI